jgi:hypothetical protein
MYSLALAGGITGEVRYFDRLERISYNALPATFKKDMTAHQYDQQANQVQCIRAGEHPWVSNGPDANLYGLEPNFGCCTANLHQGWPKLVAHMWMKTADAGLAACVYGPGIVETRIKGEPVRVEIVTEYPFRESVEIKVTTERDMVFPITLRAPGWTKGVMTVEGTPGAEGSKLEFSGGAMARAIIGPWKAGTTRLALRIPAGIESRQGENQAVSLHRGPLVFALPIEPRWKKILDRPGHDLDDWEVQPASPWNYALVLDSAAITALEPEKRPLGPITFEPVHAPLVLTLPARRLPAWGMEKGAAASPPRSPVTSDQALETIRLVPYGCTDLRITEFPWIRAE